MGNEIALKVKRVQSIMRATADPRLSRLIWKYWFCRNNPFPLLSPYLLLPTSFFLQKALQWTKVFLGSSVFLWNHLLATLSLFSLSIMDLTQWLPGYARPDMTSQNTPPPQSMVMCPSQGNENILATSAGTTGKKVTLFRGVANLRRLFENKANREKS